MLTVFWGVYSTWCWHSILRGLQYLILTIFWECHRIWCSQYSDVAIASDVDIILRGLQYRMLTLFSGGYSFWCWQYSEGATVLDVDSTLRGYSIWCRSCPPLSSILFREILNSVHIGTVCAEVCTVVKYNLISEVRYSQDLKIWN